MERLIRHGQTEANAAGLLLGRADPPLTDLGRRQAEASARVAGEVTRLVSSPLQRARETAEAFGRTVIFSTVFVYDQFNIPIWYTATLNPAGNFVWTGDVYVTNGPWFGTVPFNPGLVGLRKVGTMTWVATQVRAGTVSYTVDGVPVTKNLVRQTLQYDDYNGVYIGAVHETSTGCFNSTLNGTSEFPATISISQVGKAVTMAAAFPKGLTCTVTGTFFQDGQMAAIAANFSCTSGEVGTFSMSEMQINTSGMTGRFTANSSNFGCQDAGWMGGIRSRP